MNKILFAFLLFTVPFNASSAGFGFNAQGIKSMGMAGHVSVMALDASSVYYNPAAITKINNTFTGGIGIVFPRISYLSPSSGNVDMDPKLSLPFHFYGSIKLKGKLSAGIGLNTPYSNNIEWKEDWTGRYIVISDRLKTLFMQPTIAWKLNERFSVGAGAVLGWLYHNHLKAYDISGASTPFGKAEYKSSAISAGYSAAIHFANKKVSAGITYHSKLNFKPDGEVTFSDFPESASLEGIPSSADFETELSTPSSIDAGLAIAFTEKLTFSLNGSLTNWSESEELRYQFSNNPNLNSNELQPASDVVNISAGGQLHYSERVYLRAGVGYEKSIIDDGYVSPSFADASRLNYSAGLSWLWKEKLTLDLAVMVSDYQTRKETRNIPYNFDGEYKTTLYSIGIGISYEF